MPAGRNIQVYGIETVLEWYDNAAIPAWAVICDKNVNMAYGDDDHEAGYKLLEQYLTSLKKFESEASYTLRLYEDLNGKAIRINTPCDRAFNFCLQDKTEMKAASNLPAVQGMNTATLTQLLREISDLKTANAILEMEKEQDGQYIEELEKQLKQPPVAAEKSMGAALLEKFSPVLEKLGERIAATMFSSRESSLAGVPVSEQDEQIMIDTSIGRLKNNCGDYSLGQVLKRIADLRAAEPEKFSFYLSMLMK